MVESIPIWHKTLLTLEEAAAYSGIGTGKLRELSNDENCSFVVWNGRKRLLKRKELDEFIRVAYSI
ncbi:MAG: excisionase family DNA-binding protein [Lachnospiraceae bacterium]|jgi:excisionase family DNA binding protein|nr:excisionase family DNA-binding protein [Lachnospiraceae bacterium]